jgi:nucleoside-diphosphate-sugar epimerase
MMSTSPALAIKIGARILVTGANGFIASHVVKQLLENGFKIWITINTTSHMKQVVLQC